MKYLVVGSGGREHTIAWRLENDGSAEEVYVMPGNGGIKPEYCVNINPENHQEVINFCKEKSIDRVVVGPEAPLVDGLVDSLTEAGIKAFGPTKKAAELEGSKLFAKEIMEKYNVPTAKHWDFKGTKELLEFVEKTDSYPMVIKLDGLAAGKGVGIPTTKEEAVEFIKENVTEETEVFVEEFLEGEEASVLGISDGTNIYPFISAQDHKRAFDGDRGPNTGGMGAYAPAPVMTAELMERAKKEVLQPVVDGMKSEGIEFKGILYAGLMIKGDDIKVLEFNARFGDPEAQVILPLLDGKLGDLMSASIEGNLTEDMIKCKDKHAMTVVLASDGYPGSYEKGKEIKGLDSLDDELIVFHAGTKNSGSEIVTSGGRVLAVTALGDDLEAARDKVYDRIESIKFDGSFYRLDIGHRAFNRN